MTKRMRTLDVIARSDVTAKQKAITKKLLPPFICEEIAFDPPTNKLLEQAKSAGIIIPKNASYDDLLSLINRKNDIAPPAGIIAFAERWDIYFSQYIGNKDLYNLIFKSLSLQNKAAFFIFSVYKFLSNDKKSNLDTHPYKDIFYKFAAATTNDKRLLRSISHYKGEQLCAFGTAKNLPDNYKAGGIKTIAYKAAAAFIEEYFDDNFLPRPLKEGKKDYIATPMQNATIEKKTLVNLSISDSSATKGKNSPSVFILSKNDHYIPSRAIELKTKIIKIPELDNKATADLPVYAHENITALSTMPYTAKKHSNTQSRKLGCLTLIIVLVLFILIILFLL
ncbi:hypothetical protein [Pectinatus sottacetonis]|uniref:hypothetical protein n=1 Tax=Pectinatus sottacetonis TaxID=1002795 RepID=UPI0018C5CC49|nr:hypothetical protein [Pectinatus sottacetonis]